MAESGEQSRAALRQIDGVFDVPNWLDLLDESLTFRSAIVALPRAEAEALLIAARARAQALEQVRRKDEMSPADALVDDKGDGELLFTEGHVVEYLGFLESMGGEIDASDFLEHSQAEAMLYTSSKRQEVADLFAAALPSPEVREKVMALARKLHDAMQRLQSATEVCGFFVRLSSRSPKDAAGVNELAFLAEALKQRSGQMTLNGRFGLFCDLLLRSMRVETGQDAVHLLLSSKRVTDDILQGLEAEDQWGTPYDLSIVVRTWNSGVREDGEFRGFMSNDGHLVAISQYNEYFFQPELFEHQEAVIQRLVEFTEQHLRPRLLGSRFLPCVLDLAILQQGGLHEPFDPHGEVRVVELNPANERTSAALFDTGEVLRWVANESSLLEFRLAEALQSEDGTFLQDRIDKAHGHWKARELFRDAL